MEMNNTMDLLEESLFFEARKARFSCNAIDKVRDCASSSSTQFYSTRIFNVMEGMKGMNLSEVDFAIEASRDHWTEMEPEYYSATDLSASTNNLGNAAMCTLEDSTSVSDVTRMSGTEGEATKVDLELYEQNLAFIKSLQWEDPTSLFFEIDGVDGERVLGKIIGKGGQATVYEVNEYIDLDGDVRASSSPLVLKVFETGFPLVDLRKQWPLTLLHKLCPMYQSFDERPMHCKPIYAGTLLRDGRFAFSMGREWGDLRKLLDVRMQHNGNHRPPFMMPDGNYLEKSMYKIIWQIADGMKGMHKEGILHRDLKASNVLISAFHKDKALDDPKFESIFVEGDIWCEIADFECSIGVVGTGYWRAPEILKVVMNRSWSTMPEVLTQKSDVYSYAMTCYEIITGFVPFENIEDGKTSREDVIEGKRPKLPKHLKPWMKELMCKCWHTDISHRPTFEEIVDVLEENNNELY